MPWPRSSSREAGLRLDLGELAVQRAAGNAGQYAIVPGDLAQRARPPHPFADVDERMPPESTHKTLSAQQMAILEQWIETAPSIGRIGRSSSPQRPALPETALAHTSRTTSTASC